jgi:hypothetical protein
MSSDDLDILKDKYHDYRSLCKKVLPKVDPILVADLLNRLRKNPSPIYMVEVFTKPGLDEEKITEMIIEKTGMTPSVYDHGTHYAINQKLTLDMLKEINDHESVVAVEGDYTENITSLGPSHSWDEVRTKERESQEES